jgi:N-carbamoyl-L-amino-acid hydrolase
VRGPRGTGLTRQQIIETFERRLHAHPDSEFRSACATSTALPRSAWPTRWREALAEGEQVWDWAEQLARTATRQGSEQLTVTYPREAHRACAADLQRWMKACGFDEVPRSTPWAMWWASTGAARASAPRLLTGSHYDTVRNAGKYDGRLGILAPMAVPCCAWPAGACRWAWNWSPSPKRRASATRPPSWQQRIDRRLRPAWLEQRDADGLTMREAMQAAGLPGTMEAIAALRRDPARYLGFVEIHIEQGPVLDADLPLGVVTSINGSVRYLGEVRGQASHAGTTPMDRRRDALLAVAELALVVEGEAAAGSVAWARSAAAGAQRLDQCGAGALPLQPGPARHQRRHARRAGDAVRARELQRIAASGAACRCTLEDHGGRPCRTQPPGLAGALGSRRAAARPARCTACPAAPATTP